MKGFVVVALAAALVGCAPSSWQELQVRRTLEVPGLTPDQVGRCIMGSMADRGLDSSFRWTPLPGGRVVLAQVDTSAGLGLTPPIANTAIDLSPKEGGTLLQWRARSIYTDYTYRLDVEGPVASCRG